jgi:hypothetical protein
MLNILLKILGAVLIYLLLRYTYQDWPDWTDPEWRRPSEKGS